MAIGFWKVCNCCSLIMEIVLELTDKITKYYEVGQVLFEIAISFSPTCPTEYYSLANSPPADPYAFICEEFFYIYSNGNLLLS